MRSRAKKKVPFLDLQTQYQKVKPEIEKAISTVFNSSAYVLGPMVEKFEKDFAAYCEAKYAVGCNSGTSALHLALRAWDIGPGDEVITVSHTFIATAWAITYCGASPVFVDIDPITRTIDTSQVESKITPRTKAVIPVHLYGHPADMAPIVTLARRNGLVVIEDAAQAHGARYKGQRVGSIGDAACFSFYPGKNLGAYGEAGAVVTNDGGVVEKLRMLRDHGQSMRYHHDMVGYNYRMDGFQGAILGVKLKYLDKWNAGRRQIAEAYNSVLSGIAEIARPNKAHWAEPVFHLYVIQHPERGLLQQYLMKAGIETGLHYPIPLHRQKAYAYLNLAENSLPVTEKAAATCLSLPIYPEMSEEMVQTVCESIKQCVVNKRSIVS